MIVRTGIISLNHTVYPSDLGTTALVVWQSEKSSEKRTYIKSHIDEVSSCDTESDLG